jgi:imidazoleglycerol-phosphate dehydratase
MRKAIYERRTKETDIRISLNIDGSGECKISSEVNFFNHMIETFARHGLFDIEAKITGDLDVDQHHTIEDVGICIGMAFKEALRDKLGIHRSGFYIHAMDEALALVAIDISGRPHYKFQGKFKNKKVGDFNVELIEDFFNAFSNAICAAVHIKIFYGRSDHHKIEAIFKAFGKAMKEACKIEERMKNKLPSTKELI